MFVYFVTCKGEDWLEAWQYRKACFFSLHCVPPFIKYCTNPNHIHPYSSSLLNIRKSELLIECDIVHVWPLTLNLCFLAELGDWIVNTLHVRFHLNSISGPNQTTADICSKFETIQDLYSHNNHWKYFVQLHTENPVQFVDSSIWDVRVLCWNSYQTADSFLWSSFPDSLLLNSFHICSQSNQYELPVRRC